MATNPATAEPPGLYAISVTSELSGFTAGTLRLYEQYGLITPTRTRGGTRRYNDEDLTRLGRITELIADGINLVGIKRVLELEDSTAALRRDNARLRANNTELRAARNRDYERTFEPLPPNPAHPYRHRRSDHTDDSRSPGDDR